VAREIARGDIWMYRFREPDKRRPVVVLSRSPIIPLLHTVIVASITSTIRGAPSEVLVGVAEGLKHDCVVTLDHVHTVEQARLERRVGHLPAGKMREICRALSIATGCND
jgi:mRNA interferase MazF